MTGQEETDSGPRECPGHSLSNLVHSQGKQLSRPAAGPLQALYCQKPVS